MRVQPYFPYLPDIYIENDSMENKNYKPFKQYREMDDAQKQKISNNPNLRQPKSQEVRRKISQTMKGRWAATPRRENKDVGGTTIEDIML